jgi:hypothetical protein
MPITHLRRPPKWPPLQHLARLRHPWRPQPLPYTPPSPSAPQVAAAPPPTPGVPPLRCRCPACWFPGAAAPGGRHGLQPYPPHGRTWAWNLTRPRTLPPGRWLDRPRCPVEREEGTLHLPRHLRMKGCVDQGWGVWGPHGRGGGRACAIETPTVSEGVDAGSGSKLPSSRYTHRHTHQDWHAFKKATTTITASSGEREGGRR